MMKPDHFIGYFNLACIYSLLGDFEESLRQLGRIVENRAALSSIRETLDGLHHDPDFKTLVADARARSQFQEIERALFPGAPEHDWGRPGEDGYHTF